MVDVLIDLDSERGKELGFTSDRFDGYLWQRDRYVMISLVTSHQRGNFRQLVETILSQGLGVKIPTPLGRMEEIVRKAGYVRCDEFFELAGEWVEVWVKEPVLLGRAAIAKAEGGANR